MTGSQFTTNIENQMKTQMKKSTYSLLVRSEQSSFAETAVYGLLILSTVLSLWQFGHQRISVPVVGLTSDASIARVVSSEPKRV